MQAYALSIDGDEVPAERTGTEFIDDYIMQYRAYRR